MNCPACGHRNPAEARFCGGCAAPLDGSVPRPRTPERLAAKIRADRGALEGERKRITVLFADLVGSMEVMEAVDPEEWQGIIDRFFRILAEGVHRFEGTVDKFTGDGIMALFGAPVAHEDHARRACSAALHIQGQLAGYTAELGRTHGIGLSARIGVNSGEVVVGTIGDGGAMAYTAIGHTVGLAQRMEQIAAPNRIYLSEGTAGLVEGYYSLEDLGRLDVKGVEAPLRVYELTGVGTARGAIDIARARGLSRLVGRDEELRTLELAVERAKASDGQVIGIVGEAGVGKSRLCHELAETCRADGTPVYHVAAQAHTQAAPLAPVLQHLRSYFEIDERGPDRAARERIAERLLRLDERFGEELPLIFDFLAVPDPERPVERMDPEARRRRLLEFTRALVRAQARREPTVSVFEDLHWLDPASEAFLEAYVEVTQATRGLVIVTFRPEYRASWMSRSYYRQVALTPLSAGAVDELLTGLLGSHPSIDEVADLVRERTKGNPFFVEELVRALVDTGNLAGDRGDYRLAEPIAEAAVPPTVQAVLAARIDRLETLAKDVLQAAAVVGKRFPAPLLERVAGLEADQLEVALAALVAGEFIHEDDLYPEATYAFRHPLTQEVAYGSQLGARRRELHATTAQAIAQRYPEHLDERASMVAGHWEAAGEGLEAARWHARAAAWSGYNVPAEALRHWRRVSELGDSVPDAAEAVELGLAARVASLHFGWRLGISSDEARELFTEAERMAEAAGDVRWRALLLGGYGAVRGLGQGEIGDYADLARQAFVLAEQSGDPALHLATNAYAFFLTGEYDEGLAIVDRAIELADGDPTVGAGMPVACPYALCLAQKGLLLTQLGELDAAGRVMEEARTLAREHGDMETAGISHGISSALAFVAGDAPRALEHGRQAVEITERIGDALNRAWAWSHLGVAEKMRGEWQQAIDALERAHEIATRRRAAVEGRAFRLAHLAEAHLGSRDQQRARDLAAEAFALAREQGGPIAEIPAGLAIARVLLTASDPLEEETIEAALRGVMALAREGRARAYEPMVRVELAELARRRGDEDGRERELREAHRLFTEIGADGHVARLAPAVAGSDGLTLGTKGR